MVKTLHEVRTMAVKLRASHEGKQAVTAAEPPGDVCSRQDLNLKTCDSVAVQERWEVWFQKGRWREPGYYYLHLASITRTITGSLSAVINSSHPGLHFPSRCVLLPLSFLLCSPEVWGEGRQTPPTHRQLTALSGFSPYTPGREKT